MTDNLADRFEQVVDLHGDRPAVITDDATLTYGELERAANRFAHWLRCQGLGPGDRVGLALWNRPEHLVAMLGAFKARAVPVNVNTRYTATELEALLTDADVQLVVHEAELAPIMADAVEGPLLAPRRRRRRARRRPRRLVRRTAGRHQIRR